MPTTLNRFIAHPRIKKTLSTKPGEEGFSLIELVVVVAVLAILAAVALPNFLGVQKDAQVATAKNTLATIVKECVTSSLRGTGTSWASIQSTQGKINGLSSFLAGTCFQGGYWRGRFARLFNYICAALESQLKPVAPLPELCGSCFSTNLATVTAGQTGYW